MKANLLLLLARPTPDRCLYQGGCRLPYARRVFSLLALLLLLNQTASRAQCFQNILDATAYRLYPVGSTPYALAKGDLNGDGKPDLVTASIVDNTVSVLLGDGAGGFGNRTDFAVGRNPYSVAIGDVNGDGKPDLVAANYYDNAVSVLLGTGTGSFGAPISFAVGSNPISVAVGDLNGDGKADLVTANDGGGSVSVLLGNGAGGFAPATGFSVGNSPRSVVVADLNGDSNPDLVTANTGSNNVSVLLGNGAGGFGNRADFAVGSVPQSVTVGDLNGDGKPDLVVANGGGNRVSVLLGNGLGSFGAKTDFAVGGNPSSVAIGEFNGDGKADLVTANVFENTVSLLLGDGVGSFGKSTDFKVRGGPNSVAVGDFNGDGNADLVTALLDDNMVLVQRGDGAGHFAIKPNFAVGNKPSSVAVGDFNGDGKSDLVTANFDFSTVSVLLGTGTGSYATFATPTSFTVGRGPYSVAVGDVNGDGNPDLVTANISNNNVTVLLGDGAGDFGNRADFAVGDSPRSVAVGDLNGDGKDDLVSANYFGDNVTVLLGDGAGDFGNRADFAVGDSPRSVAVGDLNGDGKDDLVSANYFGDNVTVLLGDGAGGFGNRADFAVGSGPSSVAVADLNGDGKADLVTANSGSSNSVSVLLGNGQGSFGNRADFGVGDVPYSVAVGDVNGDGKADLVTANYDDGTVSVLLGDGAGGFGHRADFSVGSGKADPGPISVAVGDFNGDGKADLVTANISVVDITGQTGNTVTVLLGDGTGGFATNTDFRVGIGPNLVAVADLNRDGKPDLVTANYDDNTVTVLYNCTNFPLLLATTASPNPVCAGTSLALSATATGGSAPYSFTWAAPAGITLSATSTSAVSASVGAGVSGVKTFTLTAAASGGTPRSTSLVSVTVSAVPTNPSLSSGTLTCAQTSVTLTASATGGTRYTLNGAGGSQTNATGKFVVSSPGNYTAIIANANGCTAMATSRVVSNTAAPAASVASSGTLSCAVTSVTLTASGGTSYTFANGTGTLGTPGVANRLVVTSADTYSVTVSNASGCMSTATTSVVSATGTVSVSNPATSSGALMSAFSQAFTASGGAAPYSYSLASGSLPTGLSLSNTGVVSGAPTQPGSFSITVRAADANGCSGVSALYTLVINDANLTLAGLSASPGAVCVGSPVNFTASVGNVTGSYTFTLTNGLSSPLTGSASGPTFTQPLTASGTGTQSFTLTVRANGQSATSVAPLTVNSLPMASLTNNGPLSCATTSVTLTASGGSSYTFATGNGVLGTPGATNTLVVSSAGTYSVTVANASGCSATASTSVSQDNTVPTASLVSSGSLSCAVTSVTLTASASGSNGYTYAFSPGASQIGNTNQAIVTLATTYSVTVTSATGCSVVAAVTVSASTSVAAPDFATRGNQAIADGLTSVTVVQNTSPVMFSATNCGGTLTWSGNMLTGTTTLNAPTSATGVFVYQATCTVGSCVSSPASVTVTLTPANTGPVPTVNASQTATVGVPFTYTANAFADETPGSLTYTASVNPVNTLTFNPATRVIQGTPMNTGVSRVTITATDAGGLTASTSFTITVLPQPVGTPTTLTVLSRDPDNGQLNTNTLKPYLQLQNDGDSPIPYGEITVRYWLTVENPVPLRFDINYAQMGNDKVQLTYVPISPARQGATGYIEFGFDASAGSLGVGSTAVIQDLVNKQDYSQFFQGDDYSYANNANFVANPRITAYRNGNLVYGQEPDQMTGGGPSALSLTASASPTTLLTTGSTQLQASASGGTPGAPDRGYSYRFQGPGTIQTNGSIASVSNLPAGVQTFTVTVTDATTPLNQTVTATLSVTVTAPAANQPPVASPNANQTATAGLNFTYTVNAFGDDTPAGLTYTASISPANGLTFDAATRLISGIPASTGVSSVTITATDPGGLSASTTFTITVESKPVVAPATLTVYSRDPDNGQLNTNTLKPYLQLQNDGSGAIPYGQLTVRYWLTVENPAPLRYDINYAQLGSDKVHLSYVAQPRQQVSGYIEFSFDASAGNLGAMSNSGPIQDLINKQDYSYFYQGDDYSYINNGNFVPNPRITAYLNGQLIYGTEPPSAARQGAEPLVEPLQVRVLGNPVVDNQIAVAVSGIQGTQVRYVLTDIGGRLVDERQTVPTGGMDRQTLRLVGHPAGVYLLRVTTATQAQTVKVLKTE